MLENSRRSPFVDEVEEFAELVGQDGAGNICRYDLSRGVEGLVGAVARTWEPSRAGSRFSSTQRTRARQIQTDDVADLLHEEGIA